MMQLASCFPWNETFSAVFDVILLKLHSCMKMIIKQTTIQKSDIIVCHFVAVVHECDLPSEVMQK